MKIGEQRAALPAWAKAIGRRNTISSTGIPTTYNHVRFRSRLEARWAAFFDICEYRWSYEPLDLEGWIPDFLLRWDCNHSECSDEHTILVEVKPYLTIKEFDDHPMWKFSKPCDEPCIVGIGVDPSVSTKFHMVHGAGSGYEDILSWAPKELRNNWHKYWAKAGNTVQWRRR